MDYKNPRCEANASTPWNGHQNFGSDHFRQMQSEVIGPVEPGKPSCRIQPNRAHPTISNVEVACIILIGKAAEAVIEDIVVTHGTHDGKRPASSRFSSCPGHFGLEDQRVSEVPFLENRC